MTKTKRPPSIVEDSVSVRNDPRAEKPSVRPRVSRIPPAGPTSLIPREDSASGMRRQIATLHAQLAEVQRAHGLDLEGRVEDADRIEDLERRLQDLTEALKSEAAHNAEINRSLLELKRESAASESTSAALKEQLEATVAGLRERLDVTVTGLKAEHETTVTGLTQELEATRSALNKQLEETREELRVANERGVALQREFEDERRLLAESRARLGSVEADLGTATHELECERMARIPLELQIDKLQNEALVEQARKSEAAERAVAVGRELQEARVDTECLRGETERLEEMLRNARDGHRRQTEAFTNVRAALGGLLRAEKELEATRERAKEALDRNEPIAEEDDPSKA